MDDPRDSSPLSHSPSPYKVCWAYIQGWSSCFLLSSIFTHDHHSSPLPLPPLQCLGGYERGRMEHHHLMHTIGYYGNPVYIVACPGSIYWWVICCCCVRVSVYTLYCSFGRLHVCSVTYSVLTPLRGGQNHKGVFSACSNHVGFELCCRGEQCRIPLRFPEWEIWTGWNSEPKFVIQPVSTSLELLTAKIHQFSNTSCNLHSIVVYMLSLTRPSWKAVASSKLQTLLTPYQYHQ